MLRLEGFPDHFTPSLNAFPLEEIMTSTTREKTARTVAGSTVQIDRPLISNPLSAL